MPSQNQYIPYNVKQKICPITDLIETEEEYIDDLRCLLQQVTRSWDRDNPAPVELEITFDILDEIYRYNQNFCSRIKQIGTDIVSAQEIGNALIDWIEKMEEPYSAYCQNYWQGVDLWPEIDNNLNLQQTLNSISVKRNKPVTLDILFEVPLKRIRYYKKLYARILKNSEPGRPDYDILVAANKRIDNLIELEKKAKESNKQREKIPLLVPQPVLHTLISSVNPQIDITNSNMANPKASNLIELLENKANEISYNNMKENIPLAIPQPVLHTFISPANPQRDTTIPTASGKKTPKIDTNLTLPDFEDQLDTSRVLDLFTKQPKALKVRLLPPQLPFKREIILHDEFIVILPDGEGFGKHRAHIGAHLVLFTDLLLICQKLTPEEKALNPTKDFYLLYPPLSGRSITVTNIYDSKEELLNLLVLEKESIVLVADNRNIKETWLKRFNQMIEFAQSAIAKPQINTNPVSTQEVSPSTGNSLTVDSGRTLSPRLLSPTKIGLPSSPREPLLRSRSPDQIRVASSPNSSSNPSPCPSPYPLPSPSPNSSPNHSPYPSQEKDRDIQPKFPIERSNSTDSTDSVSSIASFTETIQQTPPCEVSCWIEGKWVPFAKGEKCIVEIRMTSLNRPCWVVLLESSRKIILNAWINPTTTLYRESINSMSVSCEMIKTNKYYKVTLTNQTDSDELYSNFVRMKNHRIIDLGVPFVSRSSSLQHNQQLPKEIEQTLTHVMEARVKLFLQSDYGIWKNLGWGNMKLLLETPSLRKRIIIQSDKQKSNKIVDAFVCENSVVKLNKSSITFKINLGDSTNIIYMMQMKDEASATKALEIMKTEQKS